jgi:hypothetical protein
VTRSPHANGTLRSLARRWLVTRDVGSSAVLLVLAFFLVAGAATLGTERPTPYFFWGVGCPHCEKAKPVVRRIEKDHTLRFEWLEVKRDPRGRAVFIQKVKELGIDRPVVPLFACGPHYVSGFVEKRTEGEIVAMARRCGAIRGERASPTP